MVAQNTMRAHKVNQVFRFVEGVWLHKKCRQIWFFSEKTYFTPYVCSKYHGTDVYSQWETYVYINLPVQYCTSKKSCPILYSNQLYKMGQDIFGMFITGQVGSAPLDIRWGIGENWAADDDRWN